MKFQITINPYIPGYADILRDNLVVSRADQISELVTSFGRTAAKLPTIVEEDYSASQFSLDIAVPDYERRFLTTVQTCHPDCIASITHRNFKIGMSFGERVGKLISLQEKYPTVNPPLPRDILIYCEDKAFYASIINALKQRYPQGWEGCLGVSFRECGLARDADVCILSSGGEDDVDMMELRVPEGDTTATLFLLCSDGSSSVSYRDGVVVWRLSQDDCFDTVFAYIERYMLTPCFIKALKIMSETVLDDASKSIVLSLDAVDDKVIVLLPDKLDIEEGDMRVNPQMLSGAPVPQLTVRSSYRQHIESSMADDGTIVLKPLKVGASDITVSEVLPGGIEQILAQKNVSVEDFGYAKTLSLLFYRTKDEVFFRIENNNRTVVVQSGDTVLIKLDVTPKDNPRTLDDVRAAKFIIPQNEIGVFDQQTMCFTARRPGTTKLKVQLHKVSQEVAFVVKPAVSDFKVSLVREDARQGIAAEESDVDGNVTKIRSYIAFSPELSIIREPKEADIYGLSYRVRGEGVECELDRTTGHLRLKTKMVTRQDAELDISIPGCNVHRTVKVTVKPNMTKNEANVLTTFSILAGVPLLMLLGCLIFRGGWTLFAWFNLLFAGIVWFISKTAIQKLESKTMGEKEKYRRNFYYFFCIAIVLFVLGVFRLPDYVKPGPGSEVFTLTDYYGMLYRDIEKLTEKEREDVHSEFKKVRKSINSRLKRAQLTQKYNDWCKVDSAFEKRMKSIKKIARSLGLDNDAKKLSVKKIDAIMKEFEAFDQSSLEGVEKDYLNTRYAEWIVQANARHADILVEELGMDAVPEKLSLKRLEEIRRKYAELDMSGIPQDVVVILRKRFDEWAKVATQVEVQQLVKELGFDADVNRLSLARISEIGENYGKVMQRPLSAEILNQLTVTYQTWRKSSEERVGKIYVNELKLDSDPSKLSQSEILTIEKKYSASLLKPLSPEARGVLTSYYNSWKEKADARMVSLIVNELKLDTDPYKLSIQKVNDIREKYKKYPMADLNVEVKKKLTSVFEAWQDKALEQETLLIVKKLHLDLQCEAQSDKELDALRAGYFEYIKKPQDVQLQKKIEKKYMQWNHRASVVQLDRLASRLRMDMDSTKMNLSEVRMTMDAVKNVDFTLYDKTVVIDFTRKLKVWKRNFDANAAKYLMREFDRTEKKRTVEEHHQLSKRYQELLNSNMDSEVRSGLTRAYERWLANGPVIVHGEGAKIIEK